MDRPITEIKVEGYKSIRKMDLKMGALNVLIGANGAGKSNFVSLFGFLPEVIANDLRIVVEKLGGANRLLQFGTKRTKRITIGVTFGENYYECGLLYLKAGLLGLGLEKYFHQSMNNDYFKSQSVQNSLFTSGIQEAANEGDEIANGVLQCLSGWRVYHFHDTSDTSPLRQTNPINDNEYLRHDGSNLAAFLYRLRETHPASYELIIETIRQVAPFFNNFNLRPNPLKPDTILFEWKEVGSDAYFDVNSFSDGTLRFICLATLFLQPKVLQPTTIIIDEPELGLHPSAIHLLASMLRSVSKNTQVIVATQSVTLVNQLQPKDIIVVDREDKQSVFHRLEGVDMTEWLKDYGLGDLWEKNVFGGRP